MRSVGKPETSGPACASSSIPREGTISVSRAEPGIAGDAERRRVEDVLEVEPVEDLAAGPVGGAPQVGALDSPDVVVAGHLAADEHPRAMAARVQAPVHFVGRARSAAGSVGFADVQHVEAHSAGKDRRTVRDDYAVKIVSLVGSNACDHSSNPVWMSGAYQRSASQSVSARSLSVSASMRSAGRVSRKSASAPRRTAASPPSTSILITDTPGRPRRIQIVSSRLTGTRSVRPIP